MNLRPEEISSIIKQQIESYGVKTKTEDVGYVLQAGDGIARIYGLESCMYGELLEFENGVYGMALNLEEDNVGCVLWETWRISRKGHRLKGLGARLRFLLERH